MKKNWLPIALIILFIIGYHQLVVQPAFEKARQAEQSEAEQANETLKDQSEATTTAQEAGQVATAEKVDNSYIPPELPQARQLYTEDMLQKGVEARFNGDRTIRFFSNGSVGNAVLQDYFEREKTEETPVQLLPQGFRWTSNDRAVSDCLSQLSLTKNDDHLKIFSASTPLGQCRVDYRLSTEKPGLISATLTLSGFKSSSGFVELRGLGSLGEGPQTEQNYISYRVDADTENVHGDSIFKKNLIRGNVEWLVWGDRYFASVLVPRGRFNPNLIYNDAFEFAAEDQVEKYASFGFQYPLYPETESTHYDLDMFFGTREVDALATISPSLEDSIEFGWFPAISKAMVWCLNQIFLFVGNYGLAIIVLTVLMRLAFWPLNKKVYQSSLKMKAIQPQIEALRKRYADKKDRESQQRMNLELIGLYRANKVNPMGSCLPLLLQMPIFIGLYGALNHSMDLYQAPFFLWVQDLSSKDPFYVFPVLWTVSLLSYVWLNPMPQQNQPGMPDMKWIMVAMNLFIGFLSKDWPAGLTLYLLVSNLIGIAQQVMMKRQAEKLQPIQEGA